MTVAEELTDLRVSTAVATLCTGTTYRQVDYWIGRGYMTPVRNTSGSGTRRQFSLTDLFVLATLRWLATFSAGPENVLYAAKEFGALTLPADWTGFVYVDVNGRVSRDRPTAAAVIIVDLGMIRRSVTATTLEVVSAE